MQIIDNQRSIIVLVIYLTLLNIYFSKSAYAGKATPLRARACACMCAAHAGVGGWEWRGLKFCMSIFLIILISFLFVHEVFSVLWVHCKGSFSL